MFGLHIRKDKTLTEALLKALKEYEVSVVQIQTHGPRGRQPIKIDEKFADVVREKKVRLFVHSSYPTASVWNDEEVDHIIEQLETCEDLGAEGLVVHLPRQDAKHVAKCMSNKKLITALRKGSTRIIFEMTPNKNAPRNASFLMSASVNSLGDELINILPDDKWGFCIDTAHLWGGGISFNEAGTVKQWFGGLSEYMINKIKLIHFNGSDKKTFNTGRDQHFIAFGDEDHLFGDIFDARGDIIPEKHKQSGGVLLLRYAKKLGIPVVCEINNGTEEVTKWSLAFIRDIMTKK